MATKIYEPFKKSEKEFTLVNNFLFDHIMPNVKPNAWKVLCLILRKTRGWNKLADRISFSQIKQGTGISSDGTVSNALKELIQEGYITALKSDEQWVATTYALNEDYSATISVAKGGPTTKIEVDSTTKIEDTKEKEIQERNRGGEPPVAPPTDENFTDLFPEKSPERGGKRNGASQLSEAERAHLQTFGLLPSAQSPSSEAHKTQQIIEEVWIKHISHDLKMALVEFTVAMWAGGSEIQIPRDKTTQGKWASGGKDHLDNYSLADLKRLYPLAIQHARDRGWDIYSPHSLTTALAKVVHSHSEQTTSKVDYREDPQYQFFAEQEVMKNG